MGNGLWEKLEEKARKQEVEKKEPHTYLVINRDEHYADEVIEILKRHGHWG